MGNCKAREQVLNQQATLITSRGRVFFLWSTTLWRSTLTMEIIPGNFDVLIWWISGYDGLRTEPASDTHPAL